MLRKAINAFVLVSTSQAVGTGDQSSSVAKDPKNDQAYLGQGNQVGRWNKEHADHPDNRVQNNQNGVPPVGNGGLPVVNGGDVEYQVVD